MERSNRFGVPAPKSSAIPNFAKPGYSVKDFSDVVKHVVKSHFRPQILKSQGRKVLEPQRFFGLRIFPGISGHSAPKSSALPTGPHPDNQYIIHESFRKSNQNLQLSCLFRRKYDRMRKINLNPGFFRKWKNRCNLWA